MKIESVVLLASLAVGLVSAIACLLTARHLQKRGVLWRFLRGTITVLTGLAALVAFALAGWMLWFTHRAQPPAARRALFPGFIYVRDVRQSPRPIIIHAVTIELTPGVRFLVTPGQPTGGRQLPARTTSHFLAEFHMQLAINANYFHPFRSRGPLDFYPHEGDGVDAIGIAASRGNVYAAEPWHGGTLCVLRDGRIAFDRLMDDVEMAITGNGYVLRDGRVPDFYPDAPDVRDGLDARAAVGTDRDAKHLFLVVVDGKQPHYSEGVTMAEFAQLLRGYGVETAIRLDEGGSATLVAEGPDGHPVVLNCPIHTRIPGRERPVANHLGVIVSRIAPPP